MNSTKIGLVTLHTGFNYGTLLQAYAMNNLIVECGYEPFMLWHRDGIVKGRDVTIAKLFVMFLRLIRYPYVYKRTIGVYLDGFSYDMPEETKKMFLDFSEKNFLINKMSFFKMKKVSRKNEMKAVICGSDQIWNSDSLYVNPYYFLRFAPKEKRVAYAPSFGKSEIPSYNYKILSKYLDAFKSISVREKSGCKIVEQLIGKKCDVVLDPTLAVNPKLWFNFVEKIKDDDYMLCYFLDEPKKEIIQLLSCIQDTLNLKIKYLPYDFVNYGDIKYKKYEYAGPKEFLNLIYNAKIVFTDSFHATIFSILFKIPFYTIKRNHKKSSSQQTRILNLLEQLNLQNRYIDNNFVKLENFLECDFENVDNILEKLRKQSKEFLVNAIEGPYEQ